MNILALPILLPLVFIISLIFIRRLNYARWIAISGSFILLISSLLIFREVIRHDVIVLYMGGWKAPFGITLVADYLSALMLLVAGFIAVSYTHLTLPTN